MTNIVTLHPELHRDLRIRTDVSVGLGDGQRFVQVVMRELPFVVPHFPVFLSKDAETGAFFLGAMLGVDPGENLFLQSMIEGGSYRPLTLQRTPFFVAGDQLAVDLDSPRVTEGSGERVFTEAGEPTDYLQSIVSVFQELRPGLESTRHFTDTLLALKLVEPIDIDLSFDDGERRELRDLYTIDQDALRALADDQVLDLFRRGYLHLVSLLVMSVKQVPILAQRRNRGLLNGSAADADRLY